MNPTTHSLGQQGKVPLHTRLRRDPSHAPQPRPVIETELFRITSGKFSEAETRSLLRKATLVGAGAVGACHLHQHGPRWTLSPGDMTGRTPKSEHVDESFSAACSEVATTDKSLMLKLDCIDGLPGLFVPVKTPLGESEILLIVLKSSKDANIAISAANQVTAAMQLWMKANSQRQSRWQVQSLAAIMELVGKVETSSTLDDASSAIANEMVSFLGCSNAAVGVRASGKATDIRLKAISGVHKLDRTSSLSQTYEQTLHEAEVRGEQGLFPAVDDDNAHLLLAHRQLAGAVHNEAVLSAPLYNAEGETIGVWLFTGDRDVLQNPSFSKFVSTASPHIAGSLGLLQRCEKTRIQKAWATFKEKTSKRTRQMIPLAILGLGLLMLVPIRYRVRCNCVTEPMSRRFSVAPFDGTIVNGFVEPGDVVKKGQVLAEMDGREVRLELSAKVAERQQALLQREIELTEGNVPKTFLSELENERLSSEADVLAYRQKHLSVRSSIDGVVLSGSLERSEAASVRKGEVLFEIGPTDKMRVEIAIPAEDISQVRPGNDVKIWIEGREDTPLTAEIKSIHPRSEIRDAENVFIAKIEFENRDDQYRPGMKGTVRIDGERRSLGWSMFHKSFNFVRSRLTWW